MSSGSWYRRAGEERDKARLYAKQKKELEPIVQSFSGSFSSVIQSIDSNVSKVVQELKEGIRKNTAVTSNSEAVGEGNEFEALSDAKMSNCCSSLKAEINDLERKRQEAERRADEYQRYGDEELERERQERLRRIRESLSKA